MHHIPTLKKNIKINMTVFEAISSSTRERTMNRSMTRRQKLSEVQ